MAHYIDADRLRAELERRHAYQKEMYSKTKPDGRPNDGWAESLAIMGELEELRDFLDTLPEQPVEGLEEEVERYIQECDIIDNEAGLQILTRGEYKPLEFIDLRLLAYHFAEWGVEHLKK